MRSSKAMSHASLGVVRNGSVNWSIVGNAAGWIKEAPRTGFHFTNVIKRFHTGLTGTFEIGGWWRRCRALSRASGSSQSRTLTSSSIEHRCSAIQSSKAACSRPCFHISPASPPTADPDLETSLAEQLRSVMRLLASPVVVCTSTHGGARRAMTMSSFTSLTLSPTPLVTFNVATPSRTLDAVVASREFNIHILAGDAAGAAVADHFTRGNVDGVFEELTDVLTTVDRGGSPVMSGDGVLRVLRCKVLQDGPEGGLMRVRDHVIVVGEVVDMIPGKKAEEFGLAYADRKYRQVGSVIAKKES